MKVLGLDTTRKSGVVYLYDNEINLKFSLKMGENIKHSEGVFLFIEKALFDCKIDLGDIDVFCGVVGPGSFTGIRVGMSVLKGFNMVKDEKLLPINTFEIISSKIKKGIILLNSTATSCYFAKISSGNIENAGVIAKNDVPKFAGNEKIIILKDEQKDMAFEYNNIDVVEDVDSLFFDALEVKLQSGQFDDFSPYYLQLSQAERGVSGEKLSD